MNKPNIDATTVATVWHSMQTICREMRHIVKRTAQNYLLGQLQDLGKLVAHLFMPRGRGLRIPGLKQPDHPVFSAGLRVVFLFELVQDAALGLG